MQKIVKYKRNIDIADNLKAKLFAIDQEILELTQGLIRAQAVSIKSALSTQNSWLDNLRKKWYISAANESASWHREKLLMLQKKRRFIQVELDKFTGEFWPKRIRRWLVILSIFIFSLLALLIIIMGFITTLYLLPIWGCILIVYFLINRRSANNF